MQLKKFVSHLFLPGRASVTVWTDTNKIFTYDLGEVDFVDFHHYQLSLISSNGDVLVMAYPHEVGDGDSYMMTIIGRFQYRSDYYLLFQSVHAWIEEDVTLLALEKSEIS